MVFDPFEDPILRKISGKSEGFGVQNHVPKKGIQVICLARARRYNEVSF